MNKSTAAYSRILQQLQRESLAQQLTNTQWAKQAGVRKETLSRLRGRLSCDFQTLQALAEVVGSTLAVLKLNNANSTADGRFPAHVDREFEETLLDLCASGDLDAQRWRSFTHGFFMAGLAVMVASMQGFDRCGLLDLAECLHAGSSQVGVFALWLKGSPIRPSRFLPMLEMQRRAT